MSTNFAHKAAYNKTRGFSAATDAATNAAKATRTFGTSVLIGLRAGFAAAKAARNPSAANPRNAVRVVGE